MSWSVSCRIDAYSYSRPSADRPFTSNAINMLVKTVGKRSGLPFPVHVHMLRHACGYALANAGHDTRRIQSWLGHRSIQHTVRYTELRRAVQGVLAISRLPGISRTSRPRRVLQDTRRGLTPPRGEAMAKAINTTTTPGVRRNGGRRWSGYAYEVLSDDGDLGWRRHGAAGLAGPRRSAAGCT